MLWAWTSSRPQENEPTILPFMREGVCFVIVNVSSQWGLNVDHSGVVDLGWPLVMTIVMTAGGVVLSPWKGRCLWFARLNDTPVLSCWLVQSLDDPRCQIVATRVEMIATWKPVAFDIIVWSTGGNWVNGYHLGNVWETCCWTVRITG
jgi:hypothetical protein